MVVKPMEGSNLMRPGDDCRCRLPHAVAAVWIVCGIRDPLPNCLALLVDRKHWRDLGRWKLALAGAGRRSASLRILTALVLMLLQSFRQLLGIGQEGKQLLA